MEFLTAIFIVSLYMIPAIIAGARHHHNGRAIMVLNLLLGWTFIGWVGALVWSLTETRTESRA